MSIRAVVTRGFGSFGTVADVARRGYGASAVIPPVTPTIPDAVTGGFWPRSRRQIREPEEAIQLIEAQGTEAQQERAIDVAPLIAKLEHAKATLDATQKRRARAEAKWALAVANQIQRDRDDEEVAVVLLLLH